MKTNHQRRFVDTRSRFDCMAGKAGSDRTFIGNDFTNGHRGHAKAKAGLKKYWKKREKRRRASDIRKAVAELVESD